MTPDQRENLLLLFIFCGTSMFALVFALGVYSIDLIYSVSVNYKADTYQTKLISQQIKHNLNNGGTGKACVRTP